MIDEIQALTLTRRLAGKPKWPFLDEAQAELARVLAKYARDIEHATQVITWFSESADNCPSPNELRYELRGPSLVIPEVPKTCKLGQCDGSGWREVLFLHTDVSIPGGAAYKEKKQITREQFNELADKIDWQTQRVCSGVTRCGCNPGQLPEPAKPSKSNPMDWAKPVTH